MLSSERAQPQRETLGIEVLRVGCREVDVEPGEALGHGVEVPLPLLRRRRVRVAGARVVGDLRPPARGPRPPLAQAGYREPARAPVTGLVERQDQLGRDVLDETGLELPGVIPGLVEEGARVEARVPVDRA